MHDLTDRLTDLRRPSLLIRAARHGLADYRRARELARLVRLDRTASPARALAALMEEEERLETARRAGDAGYSIARHVEVLIALMAEAQLACEPAGA